MAYSSSSGNDQDFSVDPSSAISAFKQIMSAYGKMSSGMTKDTTDLEKAMDHFSSTMGKIGDRTAQSQARMVKSYELTAATSGQSAIDRIRTRSDAMIKSLGTQETLINRVRSATEKLIEAEKNRDKGGSGGSSHGFSSSPMLAIRGIKDLFEGRTAYGEVMLGRAAGLDKMITSLSGTPALLAGVAAGFVGLSVASLHAYTSLADYGTELRNTAVRLGITSKEVVQFRFAAEAAGQDVSVFERMMRGLTQAAEDQSSAGDKARKWMQAFGVDVIGVREGTVGTRQVFLQLAEGIASITNPIERTKAELDLFKRVGIEAAPVIIGMAENLKLIGESGPSDEQTAKWVKHKQTWELIKFEIHEAWVTAQDYLATLAEITIEGAKGLKGGKGGRDPESIGFVTQGSPNPRGPGEYRPSVSIPYPDLEGFQARRRQRDADAVAAYMRTQGPEFALKAAERELAGVGEVIPGATSELGVRARRTAEQRVEVAREVVRQDGYRKAAIESLRKLEIDATERIAHPYGRIPADRQLLEYSKERGVTPDLMTKARTALAPEREFQISEGIEKSQFELRQMIHKTTMDMVEEEINKTHQASTVRLRDLSLEHISAAIQAKTNEDLRKSEERIGESRIRIAATLGADTPANRLQTEISIANVRVRASNQELADAEAHTNERARISEQEALARYPLTSQSKDLEAARVENAKNYEMGLQEVRAKNAEQIFEIESKFDEQRASEMRHQLDSIKHEAESLFETLLTHPSKFGAQFASTIRSALIRPVAEGFGERIAGSLRPTIYGSNGTGGIAGSLRGIFGGGTYTPAGVSSSGMSTTDAIIMNGSGGGGGVGSTSGTGPTPFLPGLMSGGFLNNGYIGFQGMGETPNFGSLGAPGGTSGTFGAYRLPGSSGSGGGSGIGRFGKFDIGALKESFGIGTAHATAGVDGTFGTTAGSVLTSSGAASLYLAGGLPLALAGITGQRRGTAAGIAEATGGGALVGAGIGTMIMPGFGTLLGAGIGAVAGFGIGIGEKLAGVESPRNEAKRLVQSQYHVSINNPMADQIVQIAKQSYGGTVGIAVRSPEVRQMLGLYSAGTGQALGLSASTPHGAGLTEAGGRLFSNPVYNYGNAYAASSAFPTYGGGSANSGPTYVSINFDGKSAGDAMMGQFVTPTVIQTQMASAIRGSQGRQQMAMDLLQAGSIVS